MLVTQRDFYATPVQAIHQDDLYLCRKSPTLTENQPHIYNAMKINNKNIRKPFWAILGTLTLLSIIDFILAHFSEGLGTWFWGYLFALNILLVFLIYILLGKPIFEFNSQGDLLEITNGIFSKNASRTPVIINRQNLVDFRIENHLLKKELVLKVLREKGVEDRKFEITFLSAGKRNKLEKTLKSLLSNDQNNDNVHLFI